MAVQRIVSLVPSITELLHNLGLEQEVVGLTKFCIHPEHWFRTKTRIGGTKTVQVQKVLDLQPTLVLANKEENDRAQVSVLAEHTQVLVTEVKNLGDAVAMVRQIGELTNTTSKAEKLAIELETGYAQFAQLISNQVPRRAAYLIWRKPYMTVGGDTFIHDMLGRAGFENVFGAEDRYPVITAEDLQAADPAFILLSDEPFPFQEKHQAELRDICPRATVICVDGGLFSWYGSRMLYALPYFEKLSSLAAP